MADIAIKVSNLSKCYQIYAQPHDRLKQSIYPRLQGLAGKQPKQYFREFWAVKDVSFEIKKGETVGIIGRNGSGKSTLLQMICGTLNPTSGSIQTHGRIAALLELGSGFNPEFTGRENVYMNAVVHRDYTSGADIQIKIFDDSITFFSPGRFYDGLSVAEVQTDNYQSRLRNKLVAEAFYLTNNIEKYGSGFIRIRKVLPDYPDVSLQVQEIGNGVLLTFTRAAIGELNAFASIPEKSSAKSSEKILGLLRDVPTMSAREIGQHLNISPRAVEKQLENSSVKAACAVLVPIGVGIGKYWRRLEYQPRIRHRHQGRKPFQVLPDLRAAA